MTARKSKSGSAPKYSVTYHGLHKWYKAMFEKLGWMLLHQRDGRTYKTEGYLQDVRHLLLAIAEKVATTSDGDRVEDLAIMKRNAATLLASATAILHPA